MARRPRIVIPGQPQHIVQRGDNRQDVFAIDADCQFFRDALVEAADTHGLKIHAYAWMTHHIHLLGTPEHEASISKVFQSVGGAMCSTSTTRIVDWRAMRKTGARRIARYSKP